MAYIVYIHTTPSGKMYAGITHQTAEHKIGGWLKCMNVFLKN